MQRIPIKFAAAGMSLAKPLVREDGMVLAGEGTVLTDSIIERLKNSEIPSVVVKGRPMPGLASGLELTKIKERLPYLFRKYESDQLMTTMQKMLNQYFERAIEAEEEARREEMGGQLADAQE